MNKFWIYGACGVTVIVMTVVAILIWSPPAADDVRAIPFLISDRDPAHTVAQRLEQSGLIRSQSMFLLLARLTHADRHLHKGYFFLRRDMSLLTVLDTLQEKYGSASMIKVTLPEGLSLQQVAQRLEDQHVLRHEDFLDIVQTEPSPLICQAFPFVSGHPNLEGFLFPETYMFASGVPAEQVVFAMLQNFDRQIISTWTASLNPNALNFYDTLNLAAIVEKEAATANEYGEIAGVYAHRLRLGIPLQADPTVRYALGNPDATVVFWNDLKIDSPYNTYRRIGLPPTPICSPGLAAFRAAMAPVRTPYLYFLAKNDGSGTHDFSANLQEHNAKRTRYHYEHTR